MKPQPKDLLFIIYRMAKIANILAQKSPEDAAGKKLPKKYQRQMQPYYIHALSSSST